MNLFASLKSDEKSSNAITKDNLKKALKKNIKKKAWWHDSDVTSHYKSLKQCCENQLLELQKPLQELYNQMIANKDEITQITFDNEKIKNQSQDIKNYKNVGSLLQNVDYKSWCFGGGMGGVVNPTQIAKGK